ncbi:MAG: glycine zipper 2TM domain-containing protein [Pseudomonadota bacterium]|uniref:glycine zipper 2TM domain-containing protein n=1 Tax=Alcanivorax sp. TaxID=1872427 RepID=UPI0025C4BC7F|nr:glycine zipper 2TM domain-containing protein [Alcanivorax sp.]MED5237987.1 glycine zipper 2TM domain-containing protein [Pseudomonadota bacterium]MEE3319097.1 glycine zipper 2TM domain-containing protein [Pseudomonadota bacterium]
MKSIAIATLSLAGAVAVAGAGYGAWQVMTPASSGYATVTKVEPVVKRWEEPRETCQDVAVTRQQPVKDQHRVTGSVVGAVIGGVIGHQFGGGSGKDAATAGGAIAGGIAGNQIQKGMQQKNTSTTTEQRCNTVMESRSRTEGYDVTYVFNDNEETIRMDKKPGERLRIEEGQVVTAQQ